MNEEVKSLIEYVCRNNLRDAQSVAKSILEKDTTKTNHLFCQRMLNHLNNSPLTLMELPPNLTGILVMEDISLSFHENRYYMTKEERNVIDRIIRMNQVAEKLAEYGVRYLNSTILYGESGTGKTTFGKYLAHRLGVPFAYLNFSQAIDSHLGDSQKNIARVFDYIKNQKCVFMLDEIDAVGAARGRNDVGEMNRIVIGLMRALDQLGNGVILISATNRIDILDKALLRRFSIKHEVHRLSKAERLMMAQKFYEDIGFGSFNEQLAVMCEPDQTQADLMNKLVENLAAHLEQNMEELS